MGKILLISLKLNFTPINLGCCGLMNRYAFMCRLFTLCNKKLNHVGTRESEISILEIDQS